MIRKIALALLGMLTVGILVIGGTLFFLSKGEPPTAPEGEAAEALARRMEAAVGMQHWDDTAAVMFRFEGTRTSDHFIDLDRHLVEVTWGEDPGYRVQYDSRSWDYVAFLGAEELSGAAARNAFESAYKYHVNDYFWFQPLASLRSPGAKRGLAGERALLLSFESGGVTPGDRYLIIADQNDRPERWQMWVSVIPIQGVEFTFEDSPTTETGVTIPRLHRGALFSIAFPVVKTFAEYPPPGEPDRFTPLLEHLARPHGPDVSRRSGGQTI